MRTAPRWMAAVLILASVVTPGTHATRGIVQAIDGHHMVIARSGDRGRMTFSLTPSTRREDAIVVGSTVSVRFREEGRTKIATAVAVQRPLASH